MASLTLLILAISSGCLATYYSSENSSLYTYARSSLLSFLVLSIPWNIYTWIIYPFYTSPLLGLPSLPRPLGWKHAFTLISAPAVLDAIDSTPNDGLIRHVDMFNRELLLVTTPGGVSEFFQTKADDYHKAAPIRRVLIDIIGDGLVTAEGHEHKIQRKALTPAFSFRTIKELYPLFWSKATQMISLIRDEIKTNDPGYRINIEDWTSRISLDIIGEAGFGSKFESLTYPFNPLNNHYRASFIVDESSRLMYLISILTTPAFTNLLPLKKVREKIAGKLEVNKWIKSLIEERKSDMYQNINNVDYLKKMGHKDIISTVMKAGSLSTDGLVEQTKTFLGAGHETSATGLTWGIHVLSQPENLYIQARLRQEIRAHLPSPLSGIEVYAEMLDKLPYLDAVSKEILRLYPPVPIIGRIAARDTTLCGQHVPKGTYVRVSPWANNKSKKYWGEDAREFRPERWLIGEHKATGGAGDALATITFGHGPRGCIGKGFAQAENKCILAALIGSFEFKQVGGKHVDPNIAFAITAKVVGLEVETTILEGW